MHNRVQLSNVHVQNKNMLCFVTECFCPAWKYNPCKMSITSESASRLGKPVDSSLASCKVCLFLFYILPSPPRQITWYTFQCSFRQEAAKLPISVHCFQAIPKPSLCLHNRISPTELLRLKSSLLCSGPIFSKCKIIVGWKLAELNDFHEICLP